MEEVTGPVIATTLVLIAVFVPVAFLGGTTGVLYQQFAITIAISVAISSFVALTLTPALADQTLSEERRAELAASGQITTEEWEAGLASSPLEALQAQFEHLSSAQSQLKAIDGFCTERFGDEEAAPLLCAGLIGYRAYRMALDSVPGPVEVDPEEPMAVRAGARAAPARLDPEHVVERSHHEVVVEVLARTVADGERHDRQPFGVVAAQDLEVRMRAPGLDRFTDEALLAPLDLVDSDGPLQLEHQPGADRTHDVGRPTFLTVLDVGETADGSDAILLPYLGGGSLDEAEGFDETWVNGPGAPGAEDADLSYRAWKRGFKIYFEPASQVIHDHFLAVAYSPGLVLVDIDLLGKDSQRQSGSSDGIVNGSGSLNLEAVGHILENPETRIPAADTDIHEYGADHRVHSFLSRQTRKGEYIHFTIGNPGRVP